MKNLIKHKFFRYVLTFLSPATSVVDCAVKIITEQKGSKRSLSSSVGTGLNQMSVACFSSRYTIIGVVTNLSNEKQRNDAKTLGPARSISLWNTETEPPEMMYTWCRVTNGQQVLPAASLRYSNYISLLADTQYDELDYVVFVSILFSNSS